MYIYYIYFYISTGIISPKVNRADRAILEMIPQNRRTKPTKKIWKGSRTRNMSAHVSTEQIHFTRIWKATT